MSPLDNGAESDSSLSDQEDTAREKFVERGEKAAASESHRNRKHAPGALKNGERQDKSGNHNSTNNASERYPERKGTGKSAGAAK
ncbi:hypothetical protein L210DRAFT_2729050 [Boletus edulis BED1]|uniref:Uncharacterized protein n=1 Tax=Boletus edulis BED1 TaxID=1328754 RepID=A0AAD4BAW1_BOLED|nr:hypothetical protein L210DRAFT_2729050 [Boletus edulis BED1]